MNFPLRTAFAVSYRFWIVVSSFSFASRNFLISSLISFFTHSLFNSLLFNLHVFQCFGVFSLRFVSSFYNCVAVNIFLEVLQDFLYVFGCSYVGCIYIYNVCVFLVDSSFEYYEMTFWVSLYGPLFEVCFV